jgi:hypothetical protein
MVEGESRGTEKGRGGLQCDERKRKRIVKSHDRKECQSR